MRAKQRQRFFIAVLVAWAGAWGGAVLAETIDRVVLVVNDQAVTEKEFRSLALIQNPNVESVAARPVLGTDVTDKLVDDLLLLDRAQALGLDLPISDAQVDAAMDKLAAQNGLGRDALLQQLQAKGIDLSVFRQHLLARLGLEALVQQAVVPKIRISEAEVRTQLGKSAAQTDTEQEYDLQHLLVPIKQGISQDELENLRRHAGEIREQWLKGASAADLLAENAWLTSSSANANLGWKSHQQLPEIFVTALTGVKAEQISQVVESPNGFHILKVLKVRGAGETTVTEYRVEHILLTIASEAESRGVLAKVSALREEIEAGGNFSSLAKMHSQDPGSRERGGDLGWVDVAVMVPAFATAVKTLEVDTLSQPVRSRFGYHLIRVKQQRQVQRQNNPEEQSARQRLFAQKVDEEIEDLLSDLRQVAHIEVVE